MGASRARRRHDPLLAPHRLRARARTLDRADQDRANGARDRVLARVIQAHREGRADDVGDILRRARQDGVQLTPRQVRDAVQGAQRDREQRDLQAAPRVQRRAVMERQRAVDAALD